MKKLNRVFIFIFFLCAIGLNLKADHLSGSLQLTARMSGANEVPPVSGNAQGLGVFTLSLDMTSLIVNISLADLSGPLTGIHIHEAGPDANGPVVFDLSPYIDGNRVRTTLKDISAEQRASLLAGEYYLNAHTEANPGGEIRAQILLESDFRYTAYLKGNNQVPANGSTALGWGSFNLSKAGYQLEINVTNTGLSGPITGAHLHNAAAGANGPVIEDLTPFLSGNHISVVVDPSAYINEIRNGNVYINVHTAAFPNGEIRAQLVLQSALTFDAFMSGAQEVPAVATSAQALATANVDFNLQNITVHIIADGLSGPIMGCHIHSGEAGGNGPVVYDLTPFVTGNEVLGSVPLLGSSSLEEMLSAGYYFNIHTAANPGGEIRGQIYRLAREGYVYDINGGSEVPATTSPGTGVGMVTVDRDQSNAHYMMVVSGLGEPIAAAHFHNAPAGSNGPVVYNLSSSFANFNNTAAYGYWTENDAAAPFGSANSLQFRNDEIYVNIHTASFPNGAIRGNSARGRTIPDNLLWVPMGRQGSLYPILPFTVDGDETFNWFNATGDPQATFNGIMYYTPTTLGAYYVEVSDPATPDCLYRSELRAIDDLTGCCELDGEGTEGNGCTFDFVNVGYFCKSSFNYDLQLEIAFEGPGNPDLQIYVDGVLSGITTDSGGGSYEITLLALEEGSHAISVVTEDETCQSETLMVDQECE